MRIADMARPGVEQIDSLFEQAETLPEIRRRLGLEEELHLVREVVHRRDAQREGHAPMGTHRVDRQRKTRRRAVDGGLLEHEGLAAAGRLHLPVGPLGDFEFGGDGNGNAAQFARAFQRGQEGVEGSVRQARNIRRSPRDVNGIPGQTGANLTMDYELLVFR